MKVSYRWLKDYVDIPWSPDELAERLTMAGLEVEGVQRLESDLRGVYVGEVLSVTPHPDADLRVCEVSRGNETLTVVCGAPNVRLALKTALAVPGAVLPIGTIEKVDLRGIESEGMLCSERELEIGDDSSQLIELPDDAIPGTDLMTALGYDDVVLDVAVYANRPDCLSMIGIAREVAALCGAQLNYPSTNVIERGRPVSELASLRVRDLAKCPRYSARIIDQVKLQPSPSWMQQRLRAAGMRPINNIVDITNFVMLELGQPLHAFDYHTLKGNHIEVRTAHDGESFVTLDGVTRDLTSDMLMINDAAKPVAIAGVMGGANTEVTEGAQTILLESANFSGVSVRRTARKLGILSEAALRFEKGLDPHGTVVALDRAADLMTKYAHGQVTQGILDVSAEEKTPCHVVLRPERVNALLGTAIPHADMRRILESLELTVDVGTEFWTVGVPSFRGDIELEADLIEEIARLWGFSQIPTTLPRTASRNAGQSRQLDAIDDIKDILVGAGLCEVINYSFVSGRDLRTLSRTTNMPWADSIPLVNPLSEELSVMRTTLAPGLLETASHNVSRQQLSVGVFEIGPVYIAKAWPLVEQPQEKETLAILLTAPSRYDFYDLKGIVEMVLGEFPVECEWKRGEGMLFHPGRSAVVLVNDEVVCRMGELHPDIQEQYRLANRVYLAEIELATLLRYPKPTPRFQSLPRFPGAERDMALLVDAQLPAGTLLASLRDAGGTLLQAIRIFDVYQGPQVPQGMKSVAFSFLFQADRTLTDDEVNAVMDAMYARVKRDVGAEIR